MTDKETSEPQLVLWDAQSGKTRWSITTTLPELRSVAFSPDGSLIASGHEFARLALWDAGSGALVRALEGHTSAVTAVSFGRGGLLASASLDGSIRLWDTEAGQEIRVLSGHPEGVLAIAFEPDQKHLISGGNDRLVRRWEVESGTEAGGPGRHAQPVCAVAIAPTGLIATASLSRAIKIWSEHGKEKHLIEGLKSDPWSLAISSDSMVLAASVGHRVQRWGTEAANPLPDLRGHHAVVTAVSHSDQRLASVSEDGNVALWNVASGGRERALLGLRSRGTCVAFSPDGTLVVAGSAGKNRGRR
jgi:WD40 repeat protein